MPSCLNYMIEDRLEAHKLAAIRNCSSLARLCKQLALASGSDDTKDSLITRSFINVHDRNTPINNHVTGAYSKSSNSELVAACNHSLGVSGNVDSYSFHPSSTVTVMQWNVLSQTIGFHCDKFSTINTDDFAWNRRRWKLLFELSQYAPDIICLQELDVFSFLHEILSKMEYDGRFVEKVDSPCNHLPNNFGPDGCAIFYNIKRFNLLHSYSRVLKVKGVPSNQVALMLKLECKSSGKIFTVTTTHLKARKSKLLEEVRYEQGKDLLRFVEEYSNVSEASDSSLLLDDRKCGSIVTGDFNGDAGEKFYQYIKTFGKLTSAYEDNLPSKKLYPSNWTKRVNEPEIKQTVDFIFYSANKLKVNALLSLNVADVHEAFPNSRYPSDHLSLVTKFTLL